jgi:hypothetical protein
VLDGVLIINGVRRPVQLQVTYLGTVTDPWGPARGRSDGQPGGLAITWNMPLAGGPAVSKEIQLDRTGDRPRRLKQDCPGSP